MATFTWQVYANTPGWMGVGANTYIFSGTGGLSTPITVGSWNSEAHLGNGDPGADQCGTNHVPRVTYVNGTQFDNGSGTQDLNDTNLTTQECSLRINFTDASTVAISSARFYCYNGTLTTTEAVGIEAYAFERGVTATAWTHVNEDGTSFGGDNSGERLALSDHSAATEHTYYIAISARPLSVGAKTEFDMGIALTYS